MPVLFSESIIHLAISFAVLAILIGVAIHVTGLLRADSLQQEPKTQDHLDYFRELNFRGKLSETEYRIIKKQLSTQIVEEEKDDTKKSKSIFKDIPDGAEVLLARRADSSSPSSSLEGDDTKLIRGGETSTADDTAAGL